MRIAVLNWSRRRVGGTETYLGNVIPELARLGHELFFWYETDEPRDREAVGLPEGVPGLCVGEVGARAAVEALRRWRPDLLYTHSLLSPRLEAETLAVAPSVFFAHDYYGTCVGGAKTFKRPEVRPCERRFGPACLAHYFPRRCGGLSPLTMLRRYRLQSKRLELLRRYDAVLTHSAHMRDEYLNHGLPPDRVHRIRYYARGPQGVTDGRGGGGAGKSDVRLLFTGRMDAHKGGGVLIEALPLVREKLGRPVSVTFAGDGPARPVWERAAAAAQRLDGGLKIAFTGWAPRARVEELYEEADLLIFPSLWPEPFGLAGPEAGLHGLPVAAFDVGGVSEWLTDGVNGHLAPGRPPTAEGFAGAIVECLRDPSAYARLRQGAREAAARFSLQNHLAELTNVFDSLQRNA
jgi:glycosyltransferase involved in cell wall biosynthesis